MGYPPNHDQQIRGSGLAKAAGLACLLILGISCKPLRLPPANPETLDKLAEMSKGPCFGTCPVYTFTVYSNGYAVFEGRKDAIRIGLFYRYLTPDEMKTVRDAFAETPIWNYPDIYRSELPDGPTVAISFYEPEKGRKTVKGKENRPPELQQLEQKLSRLAEGGIWKPLKEEKRAAATPKPAPPPNEIIVQLTQNTEVEPWVLKYAKARLRVVRKLSPNLPYYLLQFYPDYVDRDELLEAIRSDPAVIGAEFNRKVELREE